MRVYVNQEECIGCGFCMVSAPGVFAMNEEGKSMVIAPVTDANRAAVEEAIDGCPVNAIRKEE